METKLTFISKSWSIIKTSKKSRLHGYSMITPFQKENDVYKLFISGKTNLHLEMNKKDMLNLADNIYKLLQQQA